MAECWRSLNRNSIGPSSSSSNLAHGGYFRSKLIFLWTDRKLPKNGIYVKPWESKTHTAVQQWPTDKSSNSVMQQWPSGSGARLEIWWGLPAQVRILLTATFFAQLYSTQPQTFRKSEIKKNTQFLEKEEAGHTTIQGRMTDTDKTRDSEMQSWRSADGVWIEFR